LVDSDDGYFIQIINVETGVARAGAKQANDVIHSLIDLVDVKGNIALKSDHHIPREGLRSSCDKPGGRYWIGVDGSVLVYA
jgi:hypothetical protein